MRATAQMRWRTANRPDVQNDVLESAAQTAALAELRELRRKLAPKRGKPPKTSSGSDMARSASGNRLVRTVSEPKRASGSRAEEFVHDKYSFKGKALARPSRPPARPTAGSTPGWRNF